MVAGEDRQGNTPQLQCAEAQLQGLFQRPAADAPVTVLPVEDGDAVIGGFGTPVDFVEDAFADDPPVGGVDQKVIAVRGNGASAEMLHHFLPGKSCFGAGEAGNLRVQRVKIVLIIGFGVLSPGKPEGVTVRVSRENGAGCKIHRASLEQNSSFGNGKLKTIVGECPQNAFNFS